MPKLAIVSEPPPPEPPPPDDPPEPEAVTDDPRYFLLCTPITVGGKVIDKLLMDPTSMKGGINLFKVRRRFREENPDVYRTSFNKLGEDVYLAYLIAELNPPMVVEDVYRLDFMDQEFLFQRMQLFLYAKRAEMEAKRKNQTGHQTL